MSPHWQCHAGWVREKLRCVLCTHLDYVTCRTEEKNKIMVALISDV